MKQKKKEKSKILIIIFILLLTAIYCNTSNINEDSIKRYEIVKNYLFKSKEISLPDYDKKIIIEFENKGYYLYDEIKINNGLYILIFGGLKSVPLYIFKYYNPKSINHLITLPCKEVITNNQLIFLQKNNRVNSNSYLLLTLIPTPHSTGYYEILDINNKKIIFFAPTDIESKKGFVSNNIIFLEKYFNGLKIIKTISADKKNIKEYIWSKKEKLYISEKQ